MKGAKEWHSTARKKTHVVFDVVCKYSLMFKASILVIHSLQSISRTLTIRETSGQ